MLTTAAPSQRSYSSSDRDDRHPTTSTAMMAAMQKSKTPFELMLYPGQTHRVGGPGISEHLWGTILDFLDRHVTAK